MGSLFFLLLLLTCLQKISKASALNWADDADLFISMISNCIEDGQCHFWYWHMVKTGGTTIDLFFQRQFPNNFTKHNIWTDPRMKTFHKNAAAFCRAKVFSYQCTGEEMRVAVETCMKLNPRSRAIVLVSYREPISKFVSLVNQICNKRFEERSEEVQSFCRSCDCRDSDSTQLKNFIENTNKAFLSVSSITQMNLNEVQVLLLDTYELSEFLKAQNFEQSIKATLKKNRGQTQICDFCVTSDIIKELAPSIGVYTTLTRFII